MNIEILRAAHAEATAEYERARALRDGLAALLSKLDTNPKLAAAAGRKRAPKGTLETAILGVVGKTKLTNAAIRESLKLKNYSWPMSGLLVSKTLGKLVREKKLIAHGKGTKLSYSHR